MSHSTEDTTTSGVHSPAPCIPGPLLLAEEPQLPPGPARDEAFCYWAATSHDMASL